MKPIHEVYERILTEWSDIREHLPMLRALAAGCREVVELGTRCGYSTLALLMGQPAYLLTVDVHQHPVFIPDEAEKGATILERLKGDSRKVEIPDCDLLFIDTLHTYDQLKRELEKHGQRSRKWIALHDTDVYGRQGEQGDTKGLRPAIEEFLAVNGSWKVALDLPYCHGLMVLQRVTT